MRLILFKMYMLCVLTSNAQIQAKLPQLIKKVDPSLRRMYPKTIEEIIVQQAKIQIKTRFSSNKLTRKLFVLMTIQIVI